MNYIIKVWETEDDREQGMPYIHELKNGNNNSLIDVIKEAIELSNSNAAIEVLDNNDKLIIHISEDIDRINSKKYLQSLLNKTQLEIKISEAVHYEIQHNSESLIEGILEDIENKYDVIIDYNEPNFIIESNTLPKEKLEKIAHEINSELEKESIPYIVFDLIEKEKSQLFDLYEKLSYGEVINEYPNYDTFAELLTQLYRNNPDLQNADYNTVVNQFKKELFKLDRYGHNVILFGDDNAKIPLKTFEGVEGFDKDDLFNSLMEMEDIDKIINELEKSQPTEDYSIGGIGD